MTDNQPQPPETPQPQAQQRSAPVASQKPSVIKSLTISTLRGTITLLEKAIDKLEAPPPAEPQPSLLEKIRPVLSSIWTAWVGVLGILRPILPASISEKLPDWGLTGILASILALVVWTGSGILSSKAPEVAQVPSATETAPAPSVAPSEPKIEPISEPETPTEPQLTPEQRLIASIQDQIATATAEYSEGLIQSIQANFRASLLVVKITDEWYNFKPSRQDKLAKDMLQRAKSLDFTRLEIIDDRGQLIARSPVVGSEMIIVSRQLNTEG